MRRDVETIIAELKFSLEHVIQEEELHRVITGRLKALRLTFPTHRSLFTPSHIGFLKSLAAVPDQLQSFIELKEELIDVDTIEDYEAIVGRLVEIKGKPAPFAVCKRVTKEIRELNEKLPTIWEQDAAKWQVLVNTRFSI
jgi:hypothetical protein